MTKTFIELPLNPFTPVEDIPNIVDGLRKAFKSGVTSVQWRKVQLRQLAKCLVENETDILKAIHNDLKKDSKQAALTEHIVVVNDINEILMELDHWVAPKKATGSILNILDKIEIRSQPLGVVLIIGAWNYPLQLLIAPLSAAIAAGNCALLKPSELSPHTASILTTLLPNYLDPNCFKFVNGGVKETTAVLVQKFDHIFYTGNGLVGKIVLNAAAKHLTPVTLELGGKSPVFIDKGSDLVSTAKRILWARSMNAGQTCIAPDYILCYDNNVDGLIDAFQKAKREMFGKDLKNSKDYPRIVNERHFERLQNVLQAQRESNKNSKFIVLGEEGDKDAFDSFDKEDLYIPITLITGVTKDVDSNPILFGPILPIITVENVQEAIDFINEHDRPLALYAFSKDFKVVNRVLNSTTSGCALGNDLLMNMIIGEIPFGGVGPSGMGSYHGKYGFDTFSHKKSVVIRPHGMEFLNEIRYPPYKHYNLALAFVKKTIPSEFTIGIVRISKFIKSGLGYGIVLAVGMVLGYFLGHAKL